MGHPMWLQDSRSSMPVVVLEIKSTDLNARALSSQRFSDLSDLPTIFQKPDARVGERRTLFLQNQPDIASAPSITITAKYLSAQRSRAMDAHRH